MLLKYSVLLTTEMEGSGTRAIKFKEVYDAGETRSGVIDAIEFF
ncbi:hypothetical protein GGE09_003597 [Roseobacter sp. N2S]|nr:hypothetical protein [Roseobacter sp. N2S]